MTDNPGHTLAVVRRALRAHIEDVRAHPWSAGRKAWFAGRSFNAGYLAGLRTALDTIAEVEELTP